MAPAIDSLLSVRWHHPCLPHCAKHLDCHTHPHTHTHTHTHTHKTPVYFWGVWQLWGKGKGGSKGWEQSQYRLMPEVYPLAIKSSQLDEAFSTCPGTSWYSFSFLCTETSQLYPLIHRAPPSQSCQIFQVVSVKFSKQHTQLFAYLLTKDVRTAVALTISAISLLLFLSCKVCEGNFVVKSHS